MSSPNVKFVRNELASVMPQYKLIRDALSGETTVKAARDAYLPKPLGCSDGTPEASERYKSYLQRAVFYNVTRRTLLGMLGQVFLKSPEVEVPDMLEPLIADATGTGVSLDQLAKQAVSYVLAYSRAGVFVDYPGVDGETSIADLVSGRIRPTIYVYSPDKIINWRTIAIGAEEVLSLVVIDETYCVHDDGFEVKEEQQYRVLRLDDSGNYIQEIWRATGNAKGRKLQQNFTVHEVIMPLDASGNPFNRIPFSFIGSINNDPAVDNPNFYDLASLNIAHYRNSADYEESCYMVGQPTPVLTGLTQEWVSEVLGGKVQFGSRAGIPLPAGGDAKLLQAEPNTMIKEAMDTKERQMVAIGARLVEQKQVQRTAEEASLESASQNSTLASIAVNVSNAIKQALMWACRFIGDTTEPTYKLSTDYNIGKMSANDRAELIREWQVGAITFEEMRSGLRAAGTATEDDDIAKSKIESSTGVEDDK